MASGVSFESFSSMSLTELLSSLSPDRLKEIERTCEEEANEKPELKNLFCPITSSLMWNPVILKCNHAFERTAIEAWCQKQSTCPLDRIMIPSSSLKSNDALRKKIKEYVLEKLTDEEKAKLLPTPEEIEKSEALNLLAKCQEIDLHLLREVSHLIHSKKIIGLDGIPYIQYSGPFFAQMNFEEFSLRNDGYHGFHVRYGYK